MRKVYQGIPVWTYLHEAPAQEEGALLHAPVVIVGGGPAGLSAALDLGRKGHKVVVLTRFNFIPAASKAICYSKRTLDIFDRLGVGEAMMRKGVAWEIGKVYWGDSHEPIYQFDLLPEKEQKRPAFINLQQYYVEEALIEALSRLDNVDVRFGHDVVALETRQDGATVEVEVGEIRYKQSADWLIACDGSKSTIRELLGLDFEGRIFEDNFLIADIRMHGDYPAERRFWFDPPFNRGQSALMHKQADEVWRLDFQVGWNIDREQVVKPENVEKYVRAMLGDDIEFTPEWYSVYVFQCRRMARFVHGHVLFVGDSAHLVSPFGARGFNSGLADVENLVWKLDRILSGRSAPELLESYNYEATTTADENILNSTRSTDFLTPKSRTSQVFRDAVLELARTQEFARPLVNSGRLSTPVAYPASPLSTADVDEWNGAGLAPGRPPLDAPLGSGKWLLEQLGDDFVLLSDGWSGELPEGVRVLDISTLEEDLAVLRQRYDLTPGAAYLFRPDQYVSARWRAPTSASIRSAYIRATGANS
jgi:3-(3-hydroxy-phenyl)propionate hydroxylase